MAEGDFIRKVIMMAILILILVVLIYMGWNAYSEQIISDEPTSIAGFYDFCKMWTLGKCREGLDDRIIRSGVDYGITPRTFCEQAALGREPEEDETIPYTDEELLALCREQCFGCP